MSILLTRPATASARSGEPAGSPLAVVAALAGATSALIGLVVCASLALTGWFLADAGAHGDTLDAVGVGADVWLAGHGSRVVVSGVPVGVAPLVVTMIAVLAAFRGGRWASRSSADTGETFAMPVATFAGAYVMVAVVTCVLASRPGATPSLGRAVLGALVVGVVAGGTGLAAGSGRLAAWFARVPHWASDIGVGAVTGVLALFAAGALLAGGALLLSFNEAATVMSQLHLGVGEALSYTVVMVLFAPNAALFGSRVPARARLRVRSGDDGLTDGRVPRSRAGGPDARRAACRRAHPGVDRSPAGSPGARSGSRRRTRRTTPRARRARPRGGPWSRRRVRCRGARDRAGRRGRRAAGHRSDGGRGRPAHRSPGLRLRADGCRWPGRCARRQLVAAPTRRRAATTTGSTRTDGQHDDGQHDDGEEPTVEVLR